MAPFFMDKEDQKKWRKALDNLRFLCSCHKPVRVRRCATSGDIFGDTDLKNDHFAIRINKDLDYQTALDTLIHEWAHALSWSDAQVFKEEHGPMWGVAFAACYRAVHGE